MAYDANENYVNLFKEWLHEQEMHIEDCENAIKISKRIIKSNEKQIALYKESIEAEIKVFNEWAVKNGVEKILFEAVTP